jgi:phosphate transport system protein
MLKELQKIFQRKGLMEEAVEASHEMLKDDWEMFNEAVKSLRESDTAEVALNIEEKDIKINKYEREVRKKVLTHLAVNDVSDLNIGLVLISIVIDIERIGDYTKNIVELAQNHPGKLVFEPWEKDLKNIEEIISKNFGVLIQALKQSDEKLAKNLLDELWTVKHQCDEFNITLLKNKKFKSKVSDAVALALYLRYLKRVAAHLMNVATSIVNPFHKIGYRKV